MVTKRQFLTANDCISSTRGTEFILDSPNCDLTPILVPEKIWTHDKSFEVPEFNYMEHDDHMNDQFDWYINPIVYICIAVPRVQSNMYIFFFLNIIQTTAMSMTFENT